MFCSISTQSHLFKTYALANSIAPHGGVLHVLLIDGDVTSNKPTNVVIHKTTELLNPLATKIINKYKSNADKLRWALKPVFLLHLLQNHHKVIYVDNDIFFYGNYGFLFDELDANSVLLTPHFYESNPTKNQNWLEANFRVGLYNAGFIGVNKSAQEALEWWANCCIYNLKKSFWRGLFDDQKYLDLLPIKFDGIKILKHKGLNLAGWNYQNYLLERNSLNNPIMNKTDDLVFIHFAELSLIEFSKPDSFFKTEYHNYIDKLRMFNPKFEYNRNVFRWITLATYVYYLKYKITRLFED